MWDRCLPACTAIPRGLWPAERKVEKEIHTGGETNSTQLEPTLVSHYVPAHSSRVRVDPQEILEMSKKRSQEVKKLLQKIKCGKNGCRGSFHVIPCDQVDRVRMLGFPQGLSVLVF